MIQESPETKKAKILIVDDELIVAENIKRTLQKYGYDVVGVSGTAEETIQLAKENLPDLVLMDINLKGDIDGIEIAKKINESIDTAIVFLTAYSDVDTIERARAATPYGYLIKPFESSEMYSTIEMALYKHSTAKQLKKSEEKYRFIFENVQDVYYETTAEGNGTILEVSPSISLLTKGQYQREELLGMSILEFYSLPEEREILLAALIEKGKISDFEVSLKNRDGSFLICSVSAKVIFNNKMMPEKIIGSMHDITERKLAAESLKRSEEKFSKAFKTIPEAISIASMEDGKYIEVNDGFFKVTGFQKEEVMGHTSSDLNVWLDADARNDFIQKLTKNGFLKNFYVKFRMKNGEIRDFEVSSEIIELDGKKCSLNFMHDITEKKKADESLNEERNRLRTLIDNLPGTVSVYVKDSNSRYLVNNLAHLNSLGVKTQEEVIGKSSLDYFPEEDAERFIADEQEVIKTGKALIDKEEIFVDKDSNAKKWHITTKVPLRDSTGRITGLVGMSTNITERKLTEEALKQTEEKFKLSFMNGLDANFWATMEDGQIIEINSVFENVFGYSRDEVIGKTSLELGLYNDPVDRARMITDLKTNGFVKEVEMHGRKKDGSIITISLSVSRMQLDNQIYTLGVIRDITDRKLAEEALKQSYERYNVLIQTTIDGFCSLGMNGSILEVNDSYCLMTGYSKEQLLKMNIMDLDFLDSEEAVKKRIEGMLTNGWSRFESIHKCADGSLIDVEVSVTYMKDQNTMIAFITNTALRKKAEIALRESEERFRHSFDYSAAPVCIMDIYGKFRNVNKAFIDLFGYTEAEIKDYHFNQITHPDDLSIGSDQFSMLKKGEIKHTSFEKRYLTKNNSTIWALVSVSLVRDSNGLSLFFITQIIDITDRKKAEKELMEQMNEISRFNKLMVGREEKMIELKNEINQLLEKDGNQKKYNILFD